MTQGKYRRTILTFGFVLTALAFVGALFSPSDRPVGPSREVRGVVQSVGAVATTRARGATQVIATVRLENGALIQANVRDQTLLRAGVRARLHEYANGSQYEVVDTAPAP